MQTNKTIHIFDCDGVILDSNTIKTDCLQEIAFELAPDKADEFILYHKQNGGVSRYVKFQYFFETMLGLNDFEEKLEWALDKFKKITIDRLIKADLVPGIVEYLEGETSPKHCFVASGGSEKDLQVVFKEKNLSKYFNKIGGSPKSKQDIIDQYIAKYVDDLSKVIFYGDSVLDYSVAKQNNFDFVFIYGVTEVKDWQNKMTDVPTKNIWRNFIERK